jgi:hypothetical protein
MVSGERTVTMLEALPAPAEASLISFQLIGISSEIMVR